MKTRIQNIILMLALLGGIQQATAQVRFTLVTNIGVGSVPQSVVATNINGDNKLDLICANGADSTISLLTNNGVGVFSANTFPIHSSSPNSVAAADVNGDGKVDFICTDSRNPGKLTIFTNNGTGGFGPDYTNNVGANPYSVIAADVNNDGWLDLITANDGAGTLTVLTNNHAGRFFANSPTSTVGVGIGPICVVAADVNGDGKMDLISVNTGGNSLTVVTNNGNGVFSEKTVIGIAGQPAWATAADINSDGKVDLVCANWSGHTILVFTNDGSGGFLPSSTSDVVGHPACVIAADLKNDGGLDLISVNDNSGGILSVLTNNGSGIFSLAWSTNNLNNPVSVTAGDVNSDGKLDLITANAGGNNLGVFFNVSILPPTNHLTNIVVSPANPLIAVSSNQQFTATGYFSNGSSGTLTSNLTWSSSSPAVATIDTNGLATGLTAGNTTIKAISASISNSVTLTVVASPTISVQPTNNTVSPNGSVTLSVAATGGNLNYQWQFNGTNITGATGATYNIPIVASTNVGVYTVVVSNLAGSVTSQAAIVGTTEIHMLASIYVNGPVGTNYVIESKPGLNDGWTTRTNLALPTQPYIYIDYDSTTNPQHFYRAMPQ